MKYMSCNPFDWAFLYIRHGWPTIPVGQDPSGAWKRPLLQWEQFQKEIPSEALIDEWRKKWPEARIGIVTGAISDLIVVDIDPRHGGSADGLDLPPTLTVKTGGGGWHYYYKHPGGIKIPNATAFPKAGVDIRGDGGFVVAPPSIHKSGKAYEWTLDTDPDPALIAPCPSWIVEGNRKTASAKMQHFLRGVKQGERNDAATKAIGHFLKKLEDEEMETKGWELTQKWNQRNQPPLDEKELRSVFESISEREISSRLEKDDSNEDRRINWRRLFNRFIEEHEIEFFRDKKREGYLELSGRNGRRELINAKSEELKDVIHNFFFQQNGSPVSEQKAKECIATLAARARIEGKEIDPLLRVGRSEDYILYDLADETGRKIKLEKQGWSIVPESNSPFITNKLTGAQVEPIAGGKIEEIWKFMNIHDEEYQLLLLAFMTACFVPDMPHPLLILHGPKGAAKSSAMRVIQSLIDPSHLSALPFRKDIRDLAIGFAQKWLVPFDNVSSISGEISDVLCRAVTGDSFATRKLYSDNELHTLSFQRCVIVNGINNPARKADLLDRSILMEIERISEENRRPEKELWDAFEKEKPKLLGTLLDLICRAMAVEEVPRERLARLADFDLWGRRVSIALTGSADPFIQAYEKNVSRQSEEAIEQSSFALLLIDYLETRLPSEERIESTATVFLKGFRSWLDADSQRMPDRKFPTTPALFSQRLREIESDLFTKGFIVSRKNTGKERLIVIEKTREEESDEKTQQNENALSQAPLLLDPPSDVPDAPDDEIPF